MSRLSFSSSAYEKEINSKSIAVEFYGLGFEITPYNLVAVVNCFYTAADEWGDGLLFRQCFLPTRIVAADTIVFTSMADKGAIDLIDEIKLRGMVKDVVRRMNEYEFNVLTNAYQDS